MTGTGTAHAQPVRSWFELPSSNGYTGVVLDLESAEIHHFRDHLFAAEEPRWNADGSELWSNVGGDCFAPEVVFARDLMHDAYFGLRARGESLWLSGADVDLDASGYDGFVDAEGGSPDGGTGIVRMVQPVGSVGLTATTRVFAPWSWLAPGYVTLLTVENTAGEATGALELYHLANLNLGFGRPGPRQEIDGVAETLSLDGGSVIERGFAGSVAYVPLVPADRSTHTPAAFYAAVTDGLGDLPLPEVSPIQLDDGAIGLQWNVDDIAPGEQVTVGLFVAYHPHPDHDILSAATDWIAGRSLDDVLAAELAQWVAFQSRVDLPTGLSDDERALLHHSAAVLRMAQVRESAAFLRDQVLLDEPRRTRIDGSVASVAGGGEERPHRGAGAMLASLPPGEWTYSWVRDGAYAVVGLVDAGLYDEAAAALAFFLNAESDRYREYSELADVPLAPYAISLTRYFGFGLEESDTFCNGDFNFEFDGFGLFLWALRHYVEQSGETELLEEHWATIRDRVADVLVRLIEPDTLLIEADSSIWEVHWLGKQKHFAYTSITAARGLSDPAPHPERMGQPLKPRPVPRAGA